GEPPPGDGFVQTLVPMPERQGFLILRTGVIERAAKDRPPSVEPDHRVALPLEQAVAVSEWLRQKALSELPGGVEDRAPADPQLGKAVAVLRAALKTNRAAEATF